jgi:hypothetical protein
MGVFNCERDLLYLTVIYHVRYLHFHAVFLVELVEDSWKGFLHASVVLGFMVQPAARRESVDAKRIHRLLVIYTCLTPHLWLCCDC